MTQEKIDKAIKLQKDINRYEIVIRYASTNRLRFDGMIGIGDVSDDKELAKLIYNHCKKKQGELIEEYDKL
ncbi:MAG: hypothetical protein II817_03980 [Bacteroidales bacterium]|nr:hypothetical protein [Bacteroidales bacterium]